MSVIERDSDAVQSQAFEELGIGVREEVFQELEERDVRHRNETMDIGMQEACVPCQRKIRPCLYRLLLQELRGFGVHNPGSLSRWLERISFVCTGDGPEMKFSMLNNCLSISRFYEKTSNPLHPSSQACASKDNFLASFVYNFGSGYFEERHCTRSVRAMELSLRGRSLVCSL